MQTSGFELLLLLLLKCGGLIQTKSALPCSPSVGWQELALGQQPFRVSAILCFSVIPVNHGIVSSYPRKHSLQTNFWGHVTIENYWGLKPF